MNDKILAGFTKLYSGYALETWKGIYWSGLATLISQMRQVEHRSNGRQPEETSEQLSRF